MRRDCTYVARDNIAGRFQNILRRGGVDIDIGPPHKWATPAQFCPNPKTKPCPARHIDPAVKSAHNPRENT